MGEFEAQLVKKSKELYDLTVKLGCIETENKELKVLITDKNSILESRLDSARLITEQDLNNANDQIRELTTALD